MFLDESYLLPGDSAKRIYAAIANLPIIDPHNHADVKNIALNQPFHDLWQLFAANDHYIWEVMRKRDVPEALITGDNSSAQEKFFALARIMPELAGNPVYEWVHLDLRFLGVNTLLSTKTAEEVWCAGNRALAALPPALILEKLHVESMCSTDDPADSLEPHAHANTILHGTSIRPTWRPDKAMKITAPGWSEYIQRLGNRYNTQIDSLDELVKTLKLSHDFFAQHGCVASDHGLEIMAGDLCDEHFARRAFRHAGKASPEEAAHFAGFLLNVFGQWNQKRNWVTQLHLGPVRDCRNWLNETLGPDSGGDICSSQQNHLPGLKAFLNRFDNALKVVLYTLDPTQQATFASVARAFGAKVRLGSAWWLCDTPIGMKRQLEYIGSVDLLINFAGMVSDSRKLLSYGSRFEMFRRTLAGVLGSMVEAGQIPLDVAVNLAQNMAYHEPKRFWNL